ncbi:hypothetical protein J8273_4814 [Carpediemonas membranifera]|uniref:Uncharacterized protein n=1 Tax=Carpediemonas membranifera TaxID=201153 RepID=A0A8J6AVP5_9EUKA|nr:hypothetical protein J8273_4814 [Carpediemonas membranifera]|eukprot:KAG9393695.1 hypothetical protein J8273_4814 [Carpediemonas membranifera]
MILSFLFGFTSAILVIIFAFFLYLLPVLSRGHEKKHTPLHLSVSADSPVDEGDAVQYSSKHLSWLNCLIQTAVEQYVTAEHIGLLKTELSRATAAVTDLAKPYLSDFQVDGLQAERLNASVRHLVVTKSVGTGFAKKIEAEVDAVVTGDMAILISARCGVGGIIFIPVRLTSAVSQLGLRMTTRVDIGNTGLPCVTISKVHIDLDLKTELTLGDKEQSLRRVPLSAVTDRVLQRAAAHLSSTELIFIPVGALHEQIPDVVRSVPVGPYIMHQKALGVACEKAVQANSGPLWIKAGQSGKSL